jgi:hypothetical protein
MQFASPPRLSWQRTEAARENRVRQWRPNSSFHSLLGWWDDLLIAFATPTNYTNALSNIDSNQVSRNRVSQELLECSDDFPCTGDGQTTFWAGLLTAAYFLRHRSEELGTDTQVQQIFLTPLRPENSIWAEVPRRTGCAVCASLGFAAPDGSPNI